MIEIENIETMGWSAAIRGMRNPMNSWKKSDSHWDYFPPRDGRYCVVQKARDEEYVIGPNDRDLMLRLRRPSKVHAYDRCVHGYYSSAILVEGI